MDISSKELREVEFRERLRGYDTTEVDEFLERVAVAVDEMNAQLRKHAERADRAERQPRERASLDDEEVLRRTLVLAQRTADMAIREAQEEAAELLERARAEMVSIVGDARETARRMSVDGQRQLQEEVERLTGLRDQLRADVRTLSDLLDNERERLSEALSSALRWVDRSLSPSPEVAAHRAAPLSNEGQDAGDDVAAQVEEDAEAASHRPSGHPDDEDPGELANPDQLHLDHVDPLDHLGQPTVVRDRPGPSLAEIEDEDEDEGDEGGSSDDGRVGGSFATVRPETPRPTGVRSVLRAPDAGHDTQVWHLDESAQDNWSA